MKRLLAAGALVALLAAFAPASSAAADDGQESEAKLTGVVESLPSTPGFVGDWVVSGTTVHVTSSTEIEQEDGTLAVGATVEVKGLAGSDGSITADEIEVKDASDVQEGSASLVGTLQAIPSTPTLVGRWKVSGHVVRVRETTRIRHRSRLHRGARVRVLGRWMPDGTVRASTIVARAG